MVPPGLEDAVREKKSPLVMLQSSIGPKVFFLLVGEMVEHKREKN